MRPQCDDCHFPRALTVATAFGPAVLCLGCIAALRAKGHVVTHTERLPDNRSEPQGIATWPKGVAP